MPSVNADSRPDRRKLVKYRITDSDQLVIEAVSSTLRLAEGLGMTQ